MDMRPEEKLPDENFKAIAEKLAGLSASSEKEMRSRLEAVTNALAESRITASRASGIVQDFSTITASSVASTHGPVYRDALNQDTILDTAKVAQVVCRCGSDSCQFAAGFAAAYTAGYLSGRNTGFKEPPPTITTLQLAEAILDVELIMSLMPDKKINAIKETRAHFNVGLKEAKDGVELAMVFVAAGRVGAKETERINAEVEALVKEMFEPPQS